MSKIKILCIGDLHYSSEDLMYIRTITFKIINKARELKPDYIICLGDIIDKYTLDCKIFGDIIDFMEELNKISKTIIIIGNHDLPLDSAFGSDKHKYRILNKKFNIDIVYNIKIFQDLKIGRNFICCAYVPNDDFEKVYNNIDKSYNPLCIFAHNDFSGDKSNNKWSLVNPLIVCGHIHYYEKIDNIVYVGSPTDKEYDSSISLITLSKDEVSDERIML